MVQLHVPKLSFLIYRDFNEKLRYEDITEYNLANLLKCEEEEC